MSERRRLDLELVRRKLAVSRSQAKELVEQGKVLVGGAPANNAARQVSSAEPVTLVGPPPRFVSRGGEKLEGALDAFELDVTGRRVLDVGASTGGFTDCVLQRGAAHVVALDVGHGVLHERIRHDGRVDVRERFNARHATLADFNDTPFDLVVTDVSFISLRTIGEVLVGPVAAEGADVIALIKPQFEAGRQEVSRGRGVVKDPEVWRDVLLKVIATIEGLGAATMGLMSSPLLGAEGNVEFLAWFKAHQTQDTISTARSAYDIDAVVASVTPDAAARPATLDSEEGNL